MRGVTGRFGSARSDVPAELQARATYVLAHMSGTRGHR
jgi:hypothetical protein